MPASSGERSDGSSVSAAEDSAELEDAFSARAALAPFFRRLEVEVKARAFVRC